MNKRIMKKLVLLSLAAVASCAVSLNAATCGTDLRSADFTVVANTVDANMVAYASDAFTGITLSNDQKEKIDLIFTAVRNTPVENDEQQKEVNRKTMYQLRKVLTADQYVKYLENIALTRQPFAVL